MFNIRLAKCKIYSQLTIKFQHFSTTSHFLIHSSTQNTPISFISNFHPPLPHQFSLYIPPQNLKHTHYLCSNSKFIILKFQLSSWSLTLYSTTSVKKTSISYTENSPNKSINLYSSADSKIHRYVTLQVLKLMSTIWYCGRDCRWEQYN